MALELVMNMIQRQILGYNEIKIYMHLSISCVKN